MSTLNIIGGAFRSRKLFSPKGKQTRPTTALLRKAVFDMLQTDIEGARFLDLFSGSGAMGLEAISRGALHATLVENHKFALECIKKNLTALDVKEEVAVFEKSAVSFLKEAGIKPSSQKEPFDIVYCDPPYEMCDVHITILKILDETDLLKKGSIILLEEEFPSKRSLETLELKTIKHKNSRHFGKSFLHFFLKTH